LIDHAIRVIKKLDKKNNERPIEGDLFCDPIPGYKPKLNNSTSPIHWNREPIELKELLTALDLDTAFVNAAGDRIPFSEVVKFFETAFNVSLGSSREVKRLCFDRGDRTSVTAYLEVLISLMNKEKNRKDSRRPKR